MKKSLMSKAALVSVGLMTAAALRPSNASASCDHGGNYDYCKYDNGEWSLIYWVSNAAGGETTYSVDQNGYTINDGVGGGAAYDSYGNLVSVYPAAGANGE